MACYIPLAGCLADRLGLSLSAYIRQAVSRQVEKDEAEAPAKPHRKK